MPYVSDRQRRWAHSSSGIKTLGGKKRVHEWDEKSKGKKLPEHSDKHLKKHTKKASLSDILNADIERRLTEKLAAGGLKGLLRRGAGQALDVIEPAINKGMDYAAEKIAPTIVSGIEAATPYLSSAARSAGEFVDRHGIREPVESLLSGAAGIAGKGMEAADNLYQKAKHRAMLGDMADLADIHDVRGHGILAQTMPAWIGPYLEDIKKIENPNHLPIVMYDRDNIISFGNLRLKNLAKKRGTDYRPLNMLDKFDLQSGILRHEAMEAKNMANQVRPGWIGSAAGLPIKALPYMVPFAATGGHIDPKSLLGAGAIINRYTGHASSHVGDAVARGVDASLHSIMGKEIPNYTRDLLEDNKFVASAHMDPTVLMDESNWLSDIDSDKVRDVFTSMRKHTGELGALEAAGVPYGRSKVDLNDRALKDRIATEYYEIPSLIRYIGNRIGRK